METNFNRENIEDKPEGMENDLVLSAINDLSNHMKELKGAQSTTENVMAKFALEKALDKSQEQLQDLVSNLARAVDEYQRTKVISEESMSGILEEIANIENGLLEAEKLLDNEEEVAA